MLIVEGPDGSGKTTLAKLIEEKVDGYTYRRYSGLSSTKGPTDSRIVDWWRAQFTETTPGVYDRCFYISELVYQLVTRERPLLIPGKQMQQGIEDLWVAEPTMIFCLPQWETSREIIRAHGRDKLEGVTMESLEKVHWAYWSMYAMWTEMIGSSNITRYDFQNDDVDDLLYWVDLRR